MFSEPRHRRRLSGLAILLALVIALPVALQRPEASSQALSTVRASADATEAHSRQYHDVDLWVGMEQAAALYEQQKLEYLQAAEAAEKERLRQEAIAAEKARKAAAAAAKAAAAAAAKPVAPKASAPAVSDGSVWDRLAACESHGNWSINTGNGYYGGLQMDTAFWDTYGNSAYGQANEAPRSEQIAAATKARDSGRGYYPWPTCARKLGLI